MHREVTADHKLLSRRLLTKTNRMPRWAEHFFPANVAHSVYILEDSIVDPKNRTMTTFTWNINHARLMVGACVWVRGGGHRLWAVPTAGLCLVQRVEERCVYQVNPENSNWTEVKREAWVSSSLFGVSRAVQVSAASCPSSAVYSLLGGALKLLLPPVLPLPCAGFSTISPHLREVRSTQNHHCWWA